MKLRINSKSEWFYLLAAVVIVCGFIFWQSDLASDPPMYFSGVGQSLSTDPYMYSFHARNMILFGDADPFGDSRWIIYKHSIVSIASYIWLSLTDISLKEANTVGLLLSIGGLLLILLGLLRKHSPWVTAAVAICYLMNVSLLTYGRLPYLENGLILAISLLFYIWSRFGKTAYGVIALGAGVAVATTMGKAFGLLLLPALMASIWVSQPDDRKKQLLRLTGSFLVTCLLLILLFYWGNTNGVFDFIERQSVGLHGFPRGLTSPWAFGEHLASFGLNANLFYLNPDLLLFMLAGVGLVAFRMRNGQKSLADLPPTALFAMFWLAAGWLGLMTLNYLPLRYMLFIIPAMIVFCFTMIDWMMTSQRKALLGNGWLGPALMAIMIWIAFVNAISHGVYFNDFNAPRQTIVWLSLAGAVVIVLALRTFVQRRLRLLSRPILGSLAVILILTSITVNSARIRRKHMLTSHFSTIEANQDIDQILSDGAVVAGPYAQAITFQTGKKSLIHFFDGSGRDGNLFKLYPITHLAVDIGNWRRATEDYPELAGLEPIATYWIRDIHVQLFRVGELFGHPQTQSYELSAYEEAIDHFRAGRLENAFTALGKRRDIINTSKSAGILFSHLLKSQNRFEHVLQMLTALVDRHPTDFSLQLELGHFLEQIAIQRKDPIMLDKAKKCFQRAIELNPYKADYANNLFAETMRRLNGGNGNGH